MQRLLSIVEGALPPGRDSQAQQLLQSAMAAVRDSNPSQALAQLQQLAVLDPARAEALASDPALDSLRPAVEQLINRLTGVAKLQAEGRLAEANRLLESAPADHLLTFVQVAGRLLETGGLANLARSTAVSEAVIAECRWAPALQTTPHNTSASTTPVNWIVFGWLATGIATSAAFWWLQSDHLETLAAVFAGGLLLLLGWDRLRNRRQ